jgi:hypothetical protein
MANLNEVKKYHFIYKTTNLLNDKYYVGMHSTSNMKDGYLGSGKRLRYSIRKYGVEHFKLDILEWFDSREALVEREIQLVNEDLLKDEMCLNLRIGGIGGFISKENQYKRSVAGGAVHKDRLKTDNEYYIKHCKTFDIIRKQYIESGKHDFATFLNKTHSTETKIKMSNSHKGNGGGSENSQFGTCWITNGNENKKIYKGDLIPIGYTFGRIMKK